jgi:hypothetical protein
MGVMAEELPATTDKFDLTVHVRESYMGIHGRLSYSTDLFESVSMRHLIDDYAALIKIIMARPDAVVDNMA